MMAEVPIDVRDMERIRLLAWELNQLSKRMEHEGCKHGAALGDIVNRFTEAKLEDDRDDGEPT